MALAMRGSNLRQGKLAKRIKKTVTRIDHCLSKSILCKLNLHQSAFFIENDFYARMTVQAVKRNESLSTIILYVMSLILFCLFSIKQGNIAQCVR